MIYETTSSDQHLGLLVYLTIFINYVFIGYAQVYSVSELFIRKLNMLQKEAINPS